MSVLLNLTSLLMRPSPGCLRTVHTSAPCLLLIKMARLRVVDNSELGKQAMMEGKPPKLIHVYNKKGKATVGDVVLCAIKGLKKKGIIVGCKAQQPPHIPRTDSNNVVLIEDNGAPLGTRIVVPVPSVLRTILKEKTHAKGADYTKVLSIATRFIYELDSDDGTGDSAGPSLYQYDSGTEGKRIPEDSVAQAEEPLAQLASSIHPLLGSPSRRRGRARSGLRAVRAREGSSAGCCQTAPRCDHARVSLRPCPAPRRARHPRHRRPRRVGWRRVRLDAHPEQTGVDDQTGAAPRQQPTRQRAHHGSEGDSAFRLGLRYPAQLRGNPVEGDPQGHRGPDARPQLHLQGLHLRHQVRHREHHAVHLLQPAEPASQLPPPRQVRLHSEERRHRGDRQSQQRPPGGGAVLLRRRLLCGRGPRGRRRSGRHRLEGERLRPHQRGRGGRRQAVRLRRQNQADFERQPEEGRLQVQGSVPVFHTWG